MEQQKAEGIIEAVLFTMGKSVPVASLAELLELPEQKVWTILRDMQRSYKENGRGMMLLELEDSVQMCTTAEYYPYLIKLVSQPKKQVLTEAVLETLSIIAYKQPVPRSEIEKIRGVASDHAVNRLLEFGLIEEKGRLDAPGRPILFGTTEEFLRTFGISSISDLPVADSSELEEWKAEAEAEVPQDENTDTEAKSSAEQQEEPVQIEV
ncbi:MAG: SMC-Scp complex subunit ScpB [Lachnospiraceae bacterium]|nr:SMC-Scp complex subunit ScpB [Cuneatibacter sp.]MDD6457061.1 SMC-Scp complex subunit ScpB [Lachnospiraceae bacterium]